MSYLVDDYHGDTVAAAPVNERVAFIRRTYAHVFGAVLAFAGLSAALIASGVADKIINDVFRANRMSGLILMAVFIVGSIAAQYMAQGNKSVGTKYAGLTLYVLLYTLLFVPILTIATNPAYGIANAASPGKLPMQAGIVTLMVFGGLTAAVFISGKDFSFLGPVLMVCSFLALGVIIAAVIGGFSLGLVFASLMVALFAGYIIYDTSNIIHRYHTNEHVAASMALFGSFAMLFYYILMLFMQTRDE
ncbi:MAG TPA: Bax inhibitor-1 family protein [Gemmata sp.]|nr:Bax inhibitor-1 family protein [Gemmata sp.]